MLERKPPELIPAFAKLKPILEKAGLTTSKIPQLFNEVNDINDDMVKDIMIIFSILINHGVTASHDFEILFKKNKFITYIRSGLEDLNQYNVPRLVEKYRLLVKYDEFAIDLGLAFQYAHRAGLLDDRLCALILDHPEKSHHLVEALITLKKTPLFNPSNYEIVVQKTKATNYSYDLNSVLVKLRYRNIATQDNFEAIMRNSEFTEEMLGILNEIPIGLRSAAYQKVFDKVIQEFDARRAKEHPITAPTPLAAPQVAISASDEGPAQQKQNIYRELGLQASAVLEGVHRQAPQVDPSKEVLPVKTPSMQAQGNVAPFVSEFKPKPNFSKR